MLTPLLGLLAMTTLGAPTGELPLNFLHAPGPVTIDGNLNDWILTAPVAYEVDPSAQDRSVKTYAMWDDENIYLAYVVRDSSPMMNSGDDPSRAFKTGDSLHFYLSTSPQVESKSATGGPQDYHVLMSVMQGKPVVFAFRQAKPGVTAPETLRSPATSIEMAWMGPVPGAELAVQIARDKQGYTAEAKLPLAFFDGFHPQAGQAVATDVAVNFSDTTGTTNLAKVWWHRGASQILDVPSELRFDRDRWGQGVFRSAAEKPLVINNQNFYVVPAPGKVTIDGSLKDWDLSCAYGPQYVDAALKDKYNVTWAMMYDDQALYLGAIFNTPNYANEHGVDHAWWLGDSLEFRIQGDTKWAGGDPKSNNDILTLALWYNPKEDKDYIALQRSFNFTMGDTSQMQVKSQATATGRIFTARVPWSTVQSGRFPHAGDNVQCTLAGIWNNGLRAYAMGSISSYRGMNDWGIAHFLPEGNQKLVFVALPQPVAVETPIDAGQYKAVVQAPAKGLLSAAVYDAQGHMVRTLFAGRDVAAGPVTIGWDGKDDAGVPAPAGAYEIRAVSNAGLHAQYVTSATSPGKPACASTDPHHGWGGGWANVVDIAADPTGVYPLWGIEEGDGGLMKLDEDGNMQWRQHLPLALPGRQTAVAGNGQYIYCATEIGGDKAGAAGLWRVRADNGNYVPFPHEGSDPLEFYLDGVSSPAANAKDDTATPAVTGLAADATTLYMAEYYQDAVGLLSAETGQLQRTLSVPHPMGLCLDHNGGLLVISDKRVLAINPLAGQPQVLVSQGLDEPSHVNVDAQGNILVTDRGASQQVKRFSRDGRLLGVYGKPGGRDNNGKYQPDMLRNPAGICVAADGKIFFSEDAPPKVFYRLSAGLKYEKHWAGPWYLSGEVCVDPQNPSDLYGWGGDAFIRHHVDYQAKSSTPDAVWETFPLKEYGRWDPRVLHYQGRTYVLCGGNPVSLYRIDGYKMILVSAIGCDVREQKKPAWVFTDLNENGREDPGERVTIPQQPGPSGYFGSYWGSSIDPRDMTLYLQSDGSKQVWVVKPTWPKPGVPLYDLTNAKLIALDQADKPGKHVDLSFTWCTPDGGVYGNAMVQGSDPHGIGHSSHLSDVYIYRLDAQGNLVWRTGKKASGIAKNGEFYGRACGMGGPIGDQYFDFSDEGGQEMIYTQDGLFVGRLLDDSATAPPSEYTLLVEHFGSNVYQNAQDKQWYFTAGAGGYASIWQIVGLDKVTRLSAQVKVGG